ncbi:MAG: hypothetical protein A2161_19930 [Candidatus Schekmanbacteria bacterium RBG_13_48_7]|uniref:Cytochrome c-552/4 domain-containing protein n=1 Tax=Candidatus Schekmanbacteria bacterium RBG_13_48_7 TaxID=1817878 RepID=A0A1F7S1E1_9BACT|nr:MAG: hypothetical protein A2161_19930 [Candidatus Schekmanbacteria bacterium RBG_13_48_7]
MERHKAIFLFLCIIGITLGFAVVAFSEPTYVGASKCKICHLFEYKSWQQTKHATAFDLLKDDEKKDEKCIKCHITGSVENPGVQCEACHGAGSDFKTKNIMMDPEKRKAAGLIEKPDMKVCTKCHTPEGNPNFKEFKFEERVKDPKGIHEHKKTE